MSPPRIGSAEAGSADMLLRRTLDKPASCQCSFCRFGAWASRIVPLDASADAPKESCPAQQRA